LGFRASDSGKEIKIDGSRFVDSGAGFLIDPIEKTKEQEKLEEKLKEVIEEEGIEVPISYLTCLDCSEEFIESYLHTNFNYSVCDKCKNTEDKHVLITRTEAKNEFLLKDCDFDKREPPLKFISRKNPHNNRYAEMKLYLLLQVEQRAVEVWGSREEIEAQKETREEKREITKIKKYNKNLKQLKMNVRSSLYDKRTYKPHEHEFEEETYNEDDDNYTHTCSTCGFQETYEKL
jgi:DNA-repair protein complementing XP-A cells